MDPNHTIDLSIIIVNWNTRDMLRDCLASLPAATEGLATEILVVDNASGDESAAMVAQEFPGAMLIESGGNLGFSRGNNLALERAQGDGILLLNPDTICPPASLVRLFRFMNGHQNVGAVGPRLVDGESRPTISGGYFPRTRYHWLGVLDPWRLWLRGSLSQRIVFIPERQEASRPVEYIMGACFLMPRHALEKVGPLDDRFFMYFEETDWCYRARQAGLEVWYCAETEITHLEGKAAEMVSRFSILQFQKSYRLFVAKHYGNAAVWGFRLAQFAEYGLKSLLRRLAPGNRLRNRALAENFALRARLQLKSRIEVTPPS
ncbi:MAG: glycosyltransferase family 2 protein [Candidatus Krumholzibacteriota bacterium]